MTRCTITASVLLVELERVSAEESDSGIDTLRLQVSRDDDVVISTEVDRGDVLECEDGLTPFERTQVSALLALEWLAWPDTTAEEAPPRKSILELVEELRVQLEKGVAA